jgi:hypothetical protein
MSRLQCSLLYWVGCWFLLGFVIPELLAVWGRAPWYTLSATSWRIEDAWRGFQIVFLAGLAVLLAHIVWRFP